MQLVAGVAGALFLGPAGLGLVTAGTGFAVGAYAYGLFGPRPRGPGPGDLAAPGLQLGSQIPRPYGQVRMAVSPISIPPEFRAIEHEADSGKGAPSGPSSYTYETDVLGLVADGTRVIAVTREWWNKKLIYTALASSSPESLANSSTTDYYASVTDFFGGPSQMPAPLYEDRVTTADALAYRGMFTREYASVQCGPTKSLPSMEVEVITRGAAAPGDVFYLVNADDTAGATAATDQSGWAHTLVFQNMRQSSFAKFGATGIGNSNAAGTKQVTAAGSVPWTPASGMTLEGWFYIAGLPPSGSFTLGAVQFNTGHSMGLAYSDDVSPDANRLNLTAFAEGASTATFTPPLYVVSFDAWNHWAIDWNPATNTATLYINGTLSVQHTYVGSLPAVTSITGMTSFTTSEPLSADAFVVDGQRFTKNFRRYQAGFTPPVAAPTDDLGTAWTPAAEFLDDVILAELSLHPDFNPADVDVTDVAAVEVTGFLAVGDPAANVQELCDMLYVDIVPGNPIKFLRKGRASVVAIPHADTGCGVGAPGRSFDGLEQGGDDEISGVKAISYPDLNRDHNPGFQRADRLTTEGPDVQRIQTRLVMTPDIAKGRAITAALVARLRKQTASFGLGDKYAAAEPADAYTVSDAEANSYRLRIDRLRYADGVKDCDWELDDANALVASGITDLTDQPGVEIDASGIALWEAMDLPQLRDADEGPGYYLAVKTSDESRAFAYESANDTTYVEVQSFGLDGTFGSVVSVAGTLVASNFFDEYATITVNVGDGTLSSSTRDVLLADRIVNAFAICSTAGVCRVVGQYRTATVVSPGVYTLSGLLLDRWENARYVASVAAADVFCRLSTTGGLARMPRGISQIGIAHYVKVAAERRSPASIAGEAFTAAGVSLKPLAPVQLRRSADASTGDSTYTFQRCTRAETRFGGSLGDACPLGEAAEQYRVRFYADGTYTTVVRDLGTVTSAGFSYTGAQRTTDYGSTTATAYVQINQLSATVGEGYPLRAAA